MARNVILITIDSLRRDSVGFLNPKCNFTPRMDELAKESTVFTNAFSAGGGTIYAMGSIMTSGFPILYPADRSIRGWPTLASYFKNLGYHTAAFHSNPWLSRPFGFDVGFDEFRYIVPALPTEDVVVVGSLGQRIPEAVKEFTSITFRDAPLWIRGAELFEQASHWIRRLERNEPYFLWVHPMDVHFPYTYPTDLMKRVNPSRILRYGFDFLVRYSDSRVINTLGKNFSLYEEYSRSIQYLDAVLGNFCDKFSDAIIVIMADHGDLFGEHGHFQHPGELFNEIIRIPVMIYDKRSRPREIRSKFSSLETGDMIKSLCSEKVTAVPDPKVQEIFSIHVDYNSKVRRTSLIDGQWKLYVTEKSNRICQTRLYDIDSDPYELEEKSVKEESVVSDMIGKRVSILKNAERQKFKLSVQRLAPLLQRKLQ